MGSYQGYTVGINIFISAASVWIITCCSLIYWLSMSAFLLSWRILSVFFYYYFSKCSIGGRDKKANHLKSRAPTQSIICSGTRRNCVFYCIVRDNKRQKSLRRRQKKDAETALDQDALSGPRRLCWWLCDTLPFVWLLRANCNQTGLLSQDSVLCDAEF